MQFADLESKTLEADAERSLIYDYLLEFIDSYQRNAPNAKEAN
jgi:hypothetical protein